MLLVFVHRLCIKKKLAFFNSLAGFFNSFQIWSQSKAEFYNLDKKFSVLLPQFLLLGNTVKVFNFFSFIQRFIQYLASRNTLFNLSNFLDKSGLQGKVSFFSLKVINVLKSSKDNLVTLMNPVIQEVTFVSILPLIAFLKYNAVMVWQELLAG